MFWNGAAEIFSNYKKEARFSDRVVMIGVDSR